MTRWLRALTLGGVLGWAGLAPAWAQAPMSANRVASATPATPATTANASRPREAVPLAEDPVLEARLIEIAQELRCMVCQNESLASSHAELAEDLRREVRELMKEGKTNDEVRDFLVERYGDFVLYRPGVKPLTWVLWFGPFLLLLLALAVLARLLRARRQASPPPALTEAQRERAQSLLKD